MPLNELLRRNAQHLGTYINAHRILVYSVVSVLALSAAIINALQNHSNFYSIAIYLSRSNRSLLVLANFGVIISLLCGRLVQALFFGTLRPAEVERLYDRLWFFVTESLLAFTIFRDEFDIPFALMFGFLLFVRSFHWLASDRIEWMDQRPYPGPPTLFHIRMNVLFAVLWVVDLLMFTLAVESIISNGMGGMVLFASEYTILMASVLNTIAKYCLSVVELRRARRLGGENAPPWENKSMYTFYIELTTDFLKLSTYLAFFTLIITFYGLPLNILRDVYMTARSFITRLRALHRYQAATRNMDQRYPDATAAEMSTLSDPTCIICREEMSLPTQDGAPEPGSPDQATNHPAEGPNTTPKKLPCGHIFHFHCLRSWLERQQSCPTCRRTVLQETPAPAAPAGAAPGPRPGQPANGARPVPNPFAPQPGFQRPDNFNNNPFVGGGRMWNRFIGAVAGEQRQQRGQLPDNLRLPVDTFGATARVPNVHDGQTDTVVLSLPPGTTLRIDLPGDHQQAPIPETLAVPPGDLSPSPALRGFRGSDGEWQSWSVQHTQSNGVQGNGTAPAPTRTTSNAENATTTPAASSQASVPQLIPLYDPEPHQMETTGSRNDGSRYPPSAQGTSTSSNNLFSTPSTSTPSRTTAPPSALPDQSSTSTWRPPIPTTLTEEQLAIMDTLTREAIDERIRALERVSEAVYTSIEDLLRMRSRFPVSLPPPAPAYPSAPAASASTSSAQAPTAIAPINKPLASSTSSLNPDIMTQAPSHHISESSASPSSASENGDIASQPRLGSELSPTSSSLSSSPFSSMEATRNINGDKEQQRAEVEAQAEAPIDVVAPSPSAFDSPTWQLVPDEHDEGEEEKEEEGETFALATTATTGEEKGPLNQSSSLIGAGNTRGGVMTDEVEQGSAPTNGESQ